MKIPSFKEFKKSLTKEQVNEWCETVNQKQLQFACHPLTQDDANKNVEVLGVMTASLCMSMLGSYHKWLCEQLNKED